MGQLCPGVFGAPAPFDPASLFSGGQDGGLYDWSDTSTVWEDSAGTTPASIDGVIGRTDDKSGNGNHLIQATTAAKPFYRQSGSLYYADFDGVDDVLAAGNLPFGASIAEASVMLAMREVSRTGSEYHLLLSGTNSGAAVNKIAFLSPWLDGNIYFDAGETTGANRVTGAAPWSAGSDVVVFAENSVANSRQLFQADGVTVASDATGHTVTASDTISLGGPNPMRAHALIIRAGTVFTLAERANVLTWLASKQGRTL